jgi:hypothetical protein
MILTQTSHDFMHYIILLARLFHCYYACIASHTSGLLSLFNNAGTDLFNVTSMHAGSHSL